MKKPPDKENFNFHPDKLVTQSPPTVHHLSLEKHRVPYIVWKEDRDKTWIFNKHKGQPSWF